MRAPAILVIGLLAAASVLAGCQPKSGGDDAKVEGKTLTVYSSLPLHGPQAERSQAIVNGAKLALEQHGAKAGKFKIRYRSLDDSDASKGEKSSGMTPEQTSENAREAIDDDKTIAYIGEFDSLGTAISLPLLNDERIPQVSPGNGAIGLTTNRRGAGRGEPEKFYPEENRTFVRIVPNDSVQAATLGKLTRDEGCKAVAVLYDGSVDGRSVAEAYDEAAKADGPEIVLYDRFNPRADDYDGEAEEATKKRADCIVLAAEGGNHAAQTLTQLAEALPQARLFASASLADDRFLDPALGGLQPAVAARTRLTMPPLDPKEYPEDGREFAADYEKEYGEAPDPYAIYGYESMNLILDSVAAAGGDGNDREAVTAELLGTKDRKGAIGTYSIDAQGDTSITDYGVYRIDDGELVFDGKLNEEPVKPSARQGAGG